MIKDKYPEEYYKTLNYTNYLDRESKYIKTAYELIDLLKKLKLINEKSSILDYGCAVGFLMEGFRRAGYRKIIGFDISQWATTIAQSKSLYVTKDFEKIKEEKFDIVIALDVFEHMTDKEITQALSCINTDAIIVRIPVTENGTKAFHLEVSRRDPTHINCESREGWILLFKLLGYGNYLMLDLFSIYDAPGVFCAIFLKNKK